MQRARVAALEGTSLKLDHTIVRLEDDEIYRNQDLRRLVETLDIEPEDLLVYRALADGPYGRYRLAAVFFVPLDVGDPRVLCLDGPRGMEASEHRNGEAALCLYYKDDPPERRWRERDGIVRLFDLARQHVAAEYIWRKTGTWPIDEAPHGETESASPDSLLALPALRSPRRNDPCPCGSDRKAKRCCFR